VTSLGPLLVMPPGPLATVCLPPHGNVSHLVRERPESPLLGFRDGRTWCGRMVYPRARIDEWEQGSPLLATHLRRRPLCPACAAALREANRPPPLPVARVEIAAVAIRCPHCFAPQYRSSWARSEGDDTWPVDDFRAGASRVCVECKARMRLPDRPAAEALRQREEG
jgi:hypothetical protein